MWHSDPNIGVVMIVAIVFSGLVAVPIMIGLLIFHNARKRREAELTRLAIEKGMPVPDFTVRPSYYGTLKAGLVWIAVGIGLVLFVAIESDEGYSGISLGFIPILIGIALCIGWKLESSRESKLQLPPRT
jgi:hypothetical protein